MERLDPPTRPQPGAPPGGAAGGESRRDPSHAPGAGERPEVSELGDTLALVKAVMDRNGLEYMVIGGLAAVVCGDPRPDDPVAFAERTRVVPIRTSAGIPIDFVLAVLPFEMDAIRRARLVA